MGYHIRHEKRRIVAGFHMVGAWEKTVRQGFAQLAQWVNGRSIPAKEWVAVYYDNPDETSAEKLRCDTVVTVDNDFVVPENSEGVIHTEIAAGDYAVTTVHVTDNDFVTPWRVFFDNVMEDKSYELASRPCFELYLNDGNKDGYWDMELYVPVSRRQN